MKKIRCNSAKKLDLENVSKSTSKLPNLKFGSNSPPTPPPRGLKRENSKGSVVAAAVGRRILRQQLNNSRASPALKLSRSRLPPPVPPKSNNVRKLAGPRPRTKSWGSLQVSPKKCYFSQKCNFDIFFIIFNGLGFIPNCPQILGLAESFNIPKRELCRTKPGRDRKIMGKIPPLWWAPPPLPLIPIPF